MNKVIYKIKDLIIIILIVIGIIYYIDITNKKEAKEVFPKENFSMYFLDVGEADSIIIQNNGKYALIDAGNNEDGEKIVSYMKSLGIKEFEFVLGTHAHEDHIGGMDNVIRNFKINHYYMPNVTTTTRTFEEILEELKNHDIAFETPQIGDNIKLSETNFEVYWIGNNQEDLNSTSIILKGKYKNVSFLLTGDATTEVEYQILEKDIKSDLLKVAHHGSRQSNSDKFLRKVEPKYAIISVGKDNDYGFPKKVVLNKLELLGSKIYRTDELGTIIAYSDGNDFTFEFQKTDTNGEEK